MTSDFTLPICVTEVLFCKLERWPTRELHQYNTAVPVGFYAIYYYSWHDLASKFIMYLTSTL